MKNILFIAIVWLLPTLGFSDTLHVPSMEYPTIQSAIDAAQDYDLVLVAPGTYPERINLSGKSIVVRSDADGDDTTHDPDPEGTILSGNQEGVVVSLYGGEDQEIEGFTITTGLGTTHGGGICCGGSPRIRGNIITGNAATYGGGIYCGQGTSPWIYDNEISFNEAKSGAGIFCQMDTSIIESNWIKNNSASEDPIQSRGGGICCIAQSAATIKNNKIRANSATGNIARGAGIYCCMQSTPLVENNLVWENTVLGNPPLGDGLGSGVFADSSSPILSGNTITENSAGDGGAGIGCDNGSNLTITNSILWQNFAALGHELWIGTQTTPSTVTIGYSDVEGGVGEVYCEAGCVLNWNMGMIATDPLFVDPLHDDFDLQQDPCQPGIINPCVDTGDPATPIPNSTTRSDGVQDAFVIDMGYHHRFRTLLVPDEYATIQTAIDHVTHNGDIVIVAPGTYMENIDFDGWGITVRGTDPNDWEVIRNTVIDGGWNGTVVSFASHEDVHSVLTGFTITHGSEVLGGGIVCFNASPSLTHNIIKENQVISTGAECGRGGGIACIFSSSPVITNNLIWDNEAVNNSTGGGIYCDTSSVPEMADNTIVDNTAGLFGGGVDCNAASLVNSIVWANTAPMLAQISGDNRVVQYCDVQDGHAGIGNIEDDPMFADPNNGDFHLTWLSPCINRGTNNMAAGDDMDGDVRPFMGTTEMGVDEFVDLHTLEADAFTVSENGGTVNFSLNAGPANAGRTHILLGGISGTAPGMPLGGVTLRLNWDFFTDLVCTLMNICFVDFYAPLDAAGHGTAQLVLPPVPPGNVGLVMYYAYCLNHPFDFVSNPIQLEIVE